MAAEKSDVVVMILPLCRIGTCLPLEVTCSAIGIKKRKRRERGRT